MNHVCILDFCKIHQNISSRESRCTILVLPKREHPYLKMLYDSLERRGLTILHTHSFLSKDFLVKVLRAKIIHLHWVEYIIFRNRQLFAFISLILALMMLIFIKFIVRKKIIVTLHNVLPHEIKFPRIERIWFLCILKLADRIIVHSKCALLISLKLYGTGLSKYIVVPHGHFIGYYGDKIDKLAARGKLNIPIYALTLCVIGNLRMYKGIDKLIKVLPELLRSFPQLYVVVAGKPHDPRIVMYLNNICVHDRVLCQLKYLSDKELLLYMSVCDIGLIPYSRTTTPGSVILYASYDIPVIVPRKCAIYEVFGNEGLYYDEPHMIDSLEKLLKRIIEDRKYLEMIGKSMRTRVERYDWNAIVEAHKIQYELLCYHGGR